MTFATQSPLRTVSRQTGQTERKSPKTGQKVKASVYGKLSSHHIGVVRILIAFEDDARALVHIGTDGGEDVVGDHLAEYAY